MDERTKTTLTCRVASVDAHVIFQNEKFLTSLLVLLYSIDISAGIEEWMVDFTQTVRPELQNAKCQLSSVTPR
jgi:hypothetical protein